MDIIKDFYRELLRGAPNLVMVVKVGGGAI